MHLLNHYRTQDGKRYDYYSVVESYRKDGKNMKRILFRLGRLTPLQAQQVHNALKVTTSLDVFTATFKDIAYGGGQPYLELAVLNHMWEEEWGLSPLFPYSGRKKKGKDPQTADIAKVLVMNRCIDPGSKLYAAEWFRETAGDRVLGIGREKVNDSRIYRELKTIERQKPAIELHLYKLLKKMNPSSFRLVFYDLTDSYFEGRKCKLAGPGRTKANGFRKKRIVLSLLVNSEGYPFAWDVLEDYTADVKTIKGLSVQWKAQFGFGDHDELVLVFDRGMVSDENLEHLEGEKYLYITALDKNQIPGVEGVDIERFASLPNVVDDGREKGNAMITEQITAMGFEKYDPTTYFEDLGVADGRRRVLIFNPEMFAGERKSREELIQRAKAYLEEETKSLSKAEKARSEPVTRARIDRQLKKLKANKFVDYDLEPFVVVVKKKKKQQHQEKEVNSFRIVPKETDTTREAIKKAKRTDGLWMIVTNVPGEKTGGDDDDNDKKRFTAAELISAYRDKNRIEEAFRHVKSFLKFQPVYVRKPVHVRAHYTICVLSYLLATTVTNKLRTHPLIKEEATSVEKAYHILSKCDAGGISVRGTPHRGKKVATPTKLQRKLLAMLGCEYLVGDEYVKSIGLEP